MGAFSRRRRTCSRRRGAHRYYASRSRRGPIINLATALSTTEAGEHTFEKAVDQRSSNSPLTASIALTSRPLPRHIAVANADRCTFQWSKIRLPSAKTSRSHALRLAPGVGAGRCSRRSTGRMKGPNVRSLTPPRLHRSGCAGPRRRGHRTDRCASPTRTRPGRAVP